MSTVSLIVRSFNEEAHIARLLTGVARQTRRPDELLLVDSGSTDATLALAAAFGAKIQHIAPAEFSFGRALNEGLSTSSGDIAVIASAHVYPIYDTWLAHLISPLEDGDVALSYGRQVAPPTAPFSEARLLLRWFPNESTLKQRHPFCNNANAAIRRTVWEDLPYDEDLTGLEDLDWGKRALQSGHLLSYVAEAPVVHVHTESVAQIANRYRREAIAHKQIYHEQRLNLGTALRLGLVNIADDLKQARRQRAGREHAADIVRFRAAQFYGSYRGFAQQGPVPALLKRRFYYPHGDDGPPANGVIADGDRAILGSLIDYEITPHPGTGSAH